ncbi:MAG TPA: hypothetical protein VE619_10795 [Nitrososphaeraceae archaeon]|nr:hypothetical protein [Nitrososphaeraceae archaeon]
MVLDAAETVLGYFGFDRTVYGNPKRKTKWQWYEESREHKQER